MCVSVYVCVCACACVCMCLYTHIYTTREILKGNLRFNLDQILQ